MYGTWASALVIMRVMDEGVNMWRRVSRADVHIEHADAADFVRSALQDGRMRYLTQALNNLTSTELYPGYVLSVCLTSVSIPCSTAH